MTEPRVTRWWKRALAGLALGCCALAATCVFRASALQSRQRSAVPAPRLELDSGEAAERLAAAIRFRTVSAELPSPAVVEAFDGLHAHLHASFPNLHRALESERVTGHGLLYTWRGSDPTLPALVLLAHQDVVPVQPGTEEDWSQPPFEGTIADGFVWGRGSLDNKAALLWSLEAIERLLEAGFAPRRTVYLVAADDEEVRGRSAKRMAELLAARGIRAELVLDEGLLVTRGVVPAVSLPVALLGTAEKGFLAVELGVESPLGHVAMPASGSAVARLAAALTALERDRLPARLDGAPTELFAWLGAEMSPAGRPVSANLWLFGPVVRSAMSANPATDALLRTTTAVTMLEGSERVNVLPKRVRAVAVFFIRPGESAAQVEAHVRRVVGEGVAVKVLESGEPTPRSPADGPAFESLADSVRQVFGDALVAPSLLVGNVDARHYTALSEHVYRFTPVVAGPEDVRRIHGSNERIGVEAYADVIRFYHALLRKGAD